MKAKAPADITSDARFSRSSRLPITRLRSPLGCTYFAEAAAAPAGPAELAAAPLLAASANTVLAGRAVAAAPAVDTARKLRREKVVLMLTPSGLLRFDPSRRGSSQNACWGQTDRAQPRACSTFPQRSNLWPYAGTG